MLTTQAAAEALGLSQSHVRRLCRDGILPATMVGRDWLVDEAALSYERRKAGWPAGKPRGRKTMIEQKLTPGQAWDSYVGNQPPEEFMDISRQQGDATVDGAIDRYVEWLEETNPEFRALPEDERDAIGDALADYIRQQAESPL